MEIKCTDANIFDQKAKADILICPSGPHLNFIQGLAKEISDRAGKRFQVRCDDLKGQKPKQSGFYLFCDAYKLSDQFNEIAPLVIPDYHEYGNHKQSCDALYNCVYMFLKTCNLKGI